MKVQRLFMILLILSAPALSCGDQKGKTDETGVTTSEYSEPEGDKAMPVFASESMASTWKNYLLLKNNLVESNFSRVQTAAADMASELGGDQVPLRTIVQRIADAADIEKQREHFAELTGLLQPIVQESLQSGTLYQQFCPMAFENSGAYWLSDASEIRNPYFGDKMLKCGKVSETIVK